MKALIKGLVVGLFITMLTTLLAGITNALLTIAYGKDNLLPILFPICGIVAAGIGLSMFYKVK